jgi:2-oxoglutarate dehydrogenase E1 component
MSLCFNPSHLEYVNGVALGRTRAKQERRGDEDGRKGMCILVHGDAAFAGEGVVQETLNLSLLDAYGTGGTLHVIVNNQIGFTTGPSQGRSSQYATDVARMLSSPIFHVNGEDPEAVAQVVRLALDFRRTFAQDVFIDMYCYRQRGHNEGDEPGFTQPVMYRAIEQRKSIRDSYLDRLLQMDGINTAEAFRISETSRANLESELAHARSPQFEKHTDKDRRYWVGYHGGPVSTA